MKKNAAFTLISFAVLKWHECLSFQLPFELTVEIPVQLYLELEVNLLVHNVIEREIEREKVQMNPPSLFFAPKIEIWISNTINAGLLNVLKDYQIVHYYIYQTIIN